MIPFMTEDIYQNLVRSLDKSAPESVHLLISPRRIRPGQTRSWKKT